VDALPQIKTPVEIFQGRRDFAFGLEQGLTAYRKLGGPKRIYIGDFGHAPSTFPGPDAQAMFAEALKWFDNYLKGSAALLPSPVQVAPDPWTGSTHTYLSAPAVKTANTRTLKVRKTFGWAGKAVLNFPVPARGAVETFGSPVVTVTGSTKTRAPQLVGVLEAVAANGTSTIVSEGGTKLPARKSFTTSFKLISDATLIPARAKLRLTLSWTSTAQDSANLLYLTGVPVGSSLTVRKAYVTLPVLTRPVSR
jgi:hypothetical protein